jgi:hypothetical protein
MPWSAHATPNAPSTTEDEFITDLAETEQSNSLDMTEEEFLQLVQAGNAEFSTELEPCSAAPDVTVEPAQSGHPINVACTDPPMRCDPKIQCSFSSACVVNSCGTGSCKGCPARWGLDKLLVDAWCAYTCYLGDTQDIVGVALRFRLRLGSKIIPWVTLCSPNR